MHRRTSVLRVALYFLLALALLGGGLLLAVLTGLLPLGDPADQEPSAPAPAPPVHPAGDVSLAPFTVGGWNVGLNDADPQVIAHLLADYAGVDLWGLSEVDDESGAVPLLEQAAEAGENADFAAVLGNSGASMRLLALYNAQRFDLLDQQELDAVNTTGDARASLVLHLHERSSGADLLFMVNHLYRTRDDERLYQAQLLAQWAAEQTLPVIAVGDYNFDWAVRNGEGNHDAGYTALTADGIWEWERPADLVTTQCSGWPCTYNTVLDFVFTAGAARDWPSRSEIAVIPGDFPDDTRRSDHRAVLAQFAPGGAAGLAAETVLIPQRMPAATGPLVAATASPAVAPAIMIADIFADGAAGEAESDEYIVLLNEGAAVVNLGGWRVNAGSDEQEFTLPAYLLPPGREARIYTDEVHPESGGLSFGSRRPLWRNSGDCGSLFTPDGVRVSEYCY